MATFTLIDYEYAQKYIEIRLQYLNYCWMCDSPVLQYNGRYYRP